MKGNSGPRQMSMLVFFLVSSQGSSLLVVVINMSLSKGTPTNNTNDDGDNRQSNKVGPKRAQTQLMLLQYRSIHNIAFHHRMNEEK